MKTNLIFLAIGLLFGAILFYLIFRSDGQRKPAVIAEKQIFRDTIVKILPQKTIKLHTKPKIIRNDTIKPNFTFELDTLVNRDTLKISYSYPENNLFVRFAATPDTFRYEHTQVQINPQVSDSKWKEQALYFVSGVALGILLVKIKR